MRTLWYAAEAATTTDPVSLILQWGPAGVVIVLLLSGVLVTKGHSDDIKAERDRWRTAYETECAGHEETRAALAEAAKSAAAAIETARTTTGILSHLGHPSARPGVDR